jgi:hypothetical protein
MCSAYRGDASRRSTSARYAASEGSATNASTSSRLGRSPVKVSVTRRTSFSGGAGGAGFRPRVASRLATNPSISLMAQVSSLTIGGSPTLGTTKDQCSTSGVSPSGGRTPVPLGPEISPLQPERTQQAKASQACNDSRRRVAMSLPSCANRSLRFYISKVRTGAAPAGAGHTFAACIPQNPSPKGALEAGSGQRWHTLGCGGASRQPVEGRTRRARREFAGGVQAQHDRLRQAACARATDHA